MNVGALAAAPPTLEVHEFPDAERRVRRAVRSLGREPLVVLEVRIDHDLRAGCVEVVPQRLDGGVSAAARVKARAVPVGQGAAPGTGREIGTEPLLLG